MFKTHSPDVKGVNIINNKANGIIKNDISGTAIKFINTE